MYSELVEYVDGETVLEGCLITANAQDLSKPLVLVIHDWTGRGQYALDKAQEMAELGYAAFAIDMYGKGVFGKEGDVELNSSLMGPFASDRVLLRQRAMAGLDAARKLPQVDPERAAAIGFCFGGMCVLELARAGANLAGVVSVHGIFAPGETTNARIQSKILCLHGHDDPMVPPEQVLAFEEEMTAEKADWQMHVYGGTSHAFTNPNANNPDFGTVYSDLADRRATRSIKDFLGDLFESAG
jgi:dienelactone hydrolase